MHFPPAFNSQALLTPSKNSNGFILNINRFTKNLTLCSQVTEDCVSLQDELKSKEDYIQELQNTHEEEKTELKLELEIARSEHQLEVEFMKKELEAVKEKQNGKEENSLVAERGQSTRSSHTSHHNTEFDVEQNKYEDEILLLKEQLQEQVTLANAAIEKLEQQEFNFREELNTFKTKLEIEKEALVIESRQNIEVLRSSYEEKLQLQEEKYSEEINSLKNGYQENKIIDKEAGCTEIEFKQQMGNQYAALKAEHEDFVAALKEEYEADLRTLKLQIQQREEEYAAKESKIAAEIIDMRNEFEKQIEESKQAFDKELEEKQEFLNNHQAKVSDLEQKLEKERYNCKIGDENLRKQLNEKSCELETVRASVENWQKEVFELKEQLEREQNKSESEETLKRQAEAHRMEIQDIKEQHTIEIEGLQDMLENLQVENKELKTEFDLVVGDLSNELENGKVKISSHKQKKSSLLIEQINRLRSDFKRENRILTEELEEMRSKNEELESELEIFQTTKDLVINNSKIEVLEEKTNQIQIEKEELETIKEEIEAKVKLLEKERDDLKATVIIYKDNLKEKERLENDLRSKVESLETFLSMKNKELSSNNVEMKKYSETIENLKYIQGELEDENEKLKDEIVVAATSSDIEASPSDEIMQEKSRPSVAEYEQSIGSVVEEYEASIAALQLELRTANQQLLLKGKQVESLNSENEVLRRSLDDETLNVQSLEEKLQTNQVSYTKEVNILKEKLQTASLEKETVLADVEDQFQQKYLNKVESLKNELHSSIKDNEVKSIELLRVTKLFEENQESKTESEAENSRLNQDNEEKAAKLETLTNLNEHLHQEIKRLEMKHSESEEKHKEKEMVSAETITLKTNKISNLEEQLQLLRAEFRQAEANYKASETNRIGESDFNEMEFANLTKQLHSREEQSVREQAAHTEEVKKLQEYINIKNKEIANFNEQLQTFKEQDVNTRAAITAQNRLLEEENSQKDTEICHLKDEIEILKEKQFKNEDDQIATQLKVDGQENSKNQEIQELQSHIQVLKQEQKRNESEYIEEQGRVREENIKRFEEITILREQVIHLQEQLGLCQARNMSELLKLKQDHHERVEGLENQLSCKKKEINELRTLLDDVKSLKSEYEIKYSQEQEKRNTEQAEKIRSLENSLQVKSNEIAQLKTSLEDLKSRERETKFIQTTEQLKEHETYTVKIRELETELEKKSIEISCLISILESEQKSHDRILKETMHHLEHIEKTEEEKARARIQIKELKLEIRNLRGDLEKERERCHQLTVEHNNTKIDLTKLEEVQNLNRSLNEFEFEKGKLSHELESTKDELNKAQNKYRTLKDKFLQLKDKLQEEKHKYKEKFMSPRVDSALQIDILQSDEYERMKMVSFDAECDKSKLEDDLRMSEKELTKCKGEISALKRANAVLIKQNQVLYLETESLRKGDDLNTEDVETLEKEKRELKIENDALRFSLKQKERDFDHFDDELSKTESEDMHGRSENKNKKIREINTFLLDKNEKLHTQVEEMEKELSKLARYQTIFTRNNNSGNGNEQGPSFARDNVQHETVSQQMLEPSFSVPCDVDLNTSVELQKVVEEQVRMKEQIKQLVAEKDNLTSEVRSLKENSNANDNKGYFGIENQVRIGSSFVYLSIAFSKGL